jgi:CheY-like chemotaxis protein
MQAKRMEAKRTQPTRWTGDPRQAALASMLYPALPADEPARLATLRALDVLDTPPDRVLDELAHVASRVCGTPVALVGLVDEARQWLKARVGLALAEIRRDVALCAHAIHGRELLEVADAHVDPRFADNPLVTGPPHLRFYAGAPLIVDGAAVGTLCVIDVVPRALTADQRDALRALARSVAAQMQMRRTERDLIAARVQAERLASARARFLAGMSHEIRTPMNGVLGALELLASLGLDGNAAELAELARASGTRLMDLLDGALDLPGTAGPASAAAREAAASAAHVATAPCDVLLVDDEPVNRLIAERVLRRAGHRVAVAVDGAGALERTRERRYDLILMGCSIPGLDGLQASRALRNGDGPNRDTPIVALMADALDEQHAACRRAGIDEVLTKPIRPDALVAAVRRHVPARQRLALRTPARAAQDPAVTALAAPRRAPR